jgi:hypothetical protein
MQVVPLERATTAWASGIFATDSLTVDAVFLKRLYVLFVIELESRRVRHLGVTEYPSGAFIAWSLGTWPVTSESRVVSSNS